MNTKTKKREVLKDKRIVLIGGTSGFGFAAAQAAAEEGANVIVVSSKKENVDKAVAALPAGSKGYAVDIADEEAIRRLFEEVGEFDHLVFTAGGTLKINEVGDVNVTEAKEYFNTRFWGCYMAAKYAAKYIKKTGSITLTNGIVALRPWKGWTVTAGIAGATEALTRALAVDLAPVRVNLVCAGLVRTNLWSNLPEADREAMFTKIGASLPVGRVGESEDLAGSYIYLMKQPFCTGQTIVVDGGAVIV